MYIYIGGRTLRDALVPATTVQSTESGPAKDVQSFYYTLQDIAYIQIYLSIYIYIPWLAVASDAPPAIEESDTRHASRCTSAGVTSTCGVPTYFRGRELPNRAG